MSYLQTKNVKNICQFICSCFLLKREGNKVLAFFDVMSWGYGAYVYLQVVSPSGREIQKFEAESEGRIDFTATEDGEHRFCFRNAQTETEVSFWVNTESDSALTDVAKEGMFHIFRHVLLFVPLYRCLNLIASTDGVVVKVRMTLTQCVCFILFSVGDAMAYAEHVNDMVYSVEKLNSLVSAARVDLEAFKAREHFHRKST